ncbi:BA14K-like protein [Filomicrobium insigne]|uniref:Lectin-like protein BA14k n=1 Tax=Filomicrobium insigne TaxID=418854 RepID=A0A1H0GGN7_9HYPH|nr:BA14K family protein [Filomicrobium insigne]SDO06044.1 BA14K-like protein [Filomicrobium insigne]
MTLKYKSLMASIVALGLAGAGISSPATAVPVSSGLQQLNHAVANDSNSGVVQVRHRGRGWRHHRGGHRHGWRHRHRNRGAAIIGGVIAGALIAGAIREGRASSSAIERCEDRFRSFDRRTGTYTTYGGETRVCPYLR